MDEKVSHQGKFKLPYLVPKYEPIICSNFKLELNLNILFNFPSVTNISFLILIHTPQEFLNSLFKLDSANNSPFIFNFIRFPSFLSGIIILDDLALSGSSIVRPTMSNGKLLRGLVAEDVEVIIFFDLT
jgi:hypothetical protein